MEGTVGYYSMCSQSSSQHTPFPAHPPLTLLTSYALNLKSIPYRTEWVELPDVKATRIAHGVAPVRSHADNTDFHTLPMIHDPNTSTYVGDSFDIAVYLDAQYPDSSNGKPRLMAPGTIGVHRVFNAHVDALFTRHVILAMEGLLFNPATAEASKAEFARRANVGSWEDLRVKGSARAKLLEAFQAELEAFGRLWPQGGGDGGGPFLEGETVGYADFIVGGWLGMLSVTLPEWGQLCEWQGGRWGRLHEALRPWAEQK